MMPMPEWYVYIDWEAVGRALKFWRQRPKPTISEDHPDWIAYSDKWLAEQRAKS